MMTIYNSEHVSYCSDQNWNGEDDETRKSNRRARVVRRSENECQDSSVSRDFHVIALEIL